MMQQGSEKREELFREGDWYKKRIWLEQTEARMHKQTIIAHQAQGIHVQAMS